MTKGAELRAEAQRMRKIALGVTDSELCRCPENVFLLRRNVWKN